MPEIEDWKTAIEKDVINRRISTEMMKFGSLGSSRTPTGLHTPPGWNVSPPGDTKAKWMVGVLLWVANTVAPATFLCWLRRYPS